MVDLVSIIIPVYNLQDYIADCIESCINQTYTNLEIIVVDDGSSDNSGKIIKQYALNDFRIRYFRKTNGGVSSARNLGLTKCTGEYVTFIDGDDWVEPGFIECLLHHIYKYDADVAATGFVRHVSSGIQFNSISQKTKVLTGEKALQEVGSANPWVGFACGKLVKTDVLKSNSISFKEQLIICEDFLFWYEVFTKINLVVKGEDCLYHYIIRNNSATSTVWKSLDSSESKICAYTMALDIASKNSDLISLNKVKMKLLESYFEYLLILFRLLGYDSEKIKAIKKNINNLISFDCFRFCSNKLKVKIIFLYISPFLLYLYSKIYK